MDLEETLNVSGAADNGIISKDDKGMYGVRYNNLLSPKSYTGIECKECSTAKSNRRNAERD